MNIFGTLLPGFSIDSNRVIYRHKVVTRGISKIAVIRERRKARAELQQSSDDIRRAIDAHLVERLTSALPAGSASGMV